MEIPVITPPGARCINHLRILSPPALLAFHGDLEECRIALAACPARPGCPPGPHSTAGARVRTNLTSVSEDDPTRRVANARCSPSFNPTRGARRRGPVTPPCLDHLETGEVYSSYLQFPRGPAQPSRCGLAGGLLAPCPLCRPSPRSCGTTRRLVVRARYDAPLPDSRRAFRVQPFPCSPAPRTPAFRARCRDSGCYPPVGAPSLRAQ